MYDKMKSSKKEVKSMIVAPHIDDAVGGIGVFIQRKLRKKEPLIIVYVSSASLRGRGNKNEILEEQKRREADAKNLQRKLRTPCLKMYFLRFNNYAIIDSQAFSKYLNKLRYIIKKEKPAEIYVPAYEGGHLEHDLVNFSATLLKNEFQTIEFFEFAEYTSYLGPKIFLKKALRRISKLIGKKIISFPPDFVNQPQMPSEQLGTKEEVKMKKDLLSVFWSRDIDWLISVFGFPDRVRRLPAHNYLKSPYRYSFLNRIAAFLLRNKKYIIYDGRGFEKFKQISSVF